MNRKASSAPCSELHKWAAEKALAATSAEDVILYMLIPPDEPTPGITTDSRGATIAWLALRIELERGGLKHLSVADKKKIEDILFLVLMSTTCSPKALTKQESGAAPQAELPDTAPTAHLRRVVRKSLEQERADLGRMPEESSSDASPAFETVFISVDEAAKLTGLDRKSIRKALKNKEIPGMRIGRLWRVNRWWIDQLREGRDG